MLKGLEDGTITRDVPVVQDGYWTYEDKSTKLEIGDLIYYWIYVVHNGNGYKFIVDDAYTVTGQFCWNNFFFIQKIKFLIYYVIFITIIVCFAELVLDIGFPVDPELEDAETKSDSSTPSIIVSSTDDPSEE